MAKKAVQTHPHKAAILALLFSVPVFLLNMIANNQIEPFYTLFKIDTGSSFFANPVGNITASISLLLLPVGGVIALWPMVQNGWRKVYPLNAILALMIFMLFIVITGAFLSEIYECNISLVPNCD